MISNSCKKEDTPSVTTTDVSSLGQTSASCGGTITSEGGSTVLSRGVCWGTNATPKITDSKTTDGAGAGSFTSAITGLSAGTKYFVRAYATNGKGTGYGMAMSFTTLPATAPSVSTANVTAITIISANCGGTIGDDGAASITSRGVCWSTAINPTTADNKTSDGTGTGTFTSTLTGLTGNTFYYVRAYAINSVGTSYGNLVGFLTSPILPTISTTAITSISFTTASSGGNISNNGGATVTASGVCWSTTSNPTITNNKTIDNFPGGIFTSNITGLIAGTLYYVRAYATNSVGTAYGQLIQFTSLVNYTGQTGTVNDIDGNTYPTIGIGNQIWMSINLKTTKYTNGDLIGTTTPATLSYINEIAPKYQWAYNGNESNVAIYGRLYTWYAVTDSRKVCPTGWHMPTSTEWGTLINYVGGNSVAGGKLKETGLTHWLSPNTGATNNYGFIALPGGFHSFVGQFNFIGSEGMWWSSTGDPTDPTGSKDAYVFEIDYNYGNASGHLTGDNYAFSVRCLKDN
jgi:uncharacterized protein (TIGR02145 family)